MTTLSTFLICSVLIWLVLGGHHAQSEPQQCDITESREDCGYYGINAQECMARGCCWAPTIASSAAHREKARHLSGQQQARLGMSASNTVSDVPWCFHPNAHTKDHYVVQSVAETVLGYTLLLAPDAGRARAQQGTIFGPSFPLLRVDVAHEAGARLHVRVTPANSSQWSVPLDLLPRPPPPEARPKDLHLVFQAPTVGAPFTFKVTRTSSTQRTAGPGSAVRQPPAPPLLDTSGHGLVYKEQYIEFGTAVQQSASLYGLGDTVQPEGWRLVRDGRTLTLWAADAYAGTPRHNIYSSHPFWLEVREDGSAHGVLLLNSNAMDVTLSPDALTFRITGGELDLYVFGGPSPEAVVEQYHEVVGRPALPPLWALGFHQCKWGYHDVATVEAVVAGYRHAGIPLEAMWADIDYMDRHRDFTLDPEHFPLAAMQQLVERLHAAHQHWVPIIDPGIPIVPGYDAYDRGLAGGLFVRDRTGAPLLGEVWPGPTHWPDFLHPDTSAYWVSLLRGMWEAVPFDGLWIDMNEPSNFCPGDVCWMPGTQHAGLNSSRKLLSRKQMLHTATIPQQLAEGASGAGPGAGTGGPPGATAGQVRSSTSETGRLRRRGALQGRQAQNCMIECKPADPDDPLSHPPYAINNQNGHLPLGWQTLAPTARHHGGITHYDAHNLYGLAEAKTTAAALRELRGARSFVLSRSTFPGSGVHTARWTGDNAADWDNLRWSVTALFSSWAWGIPQSGSDICGFKGGSHEELCARWLAAGAFYTFVRNHADLNSPPQEAYVWPAAAAAARTALSLRYALLRYLYSGHYMAHLMGGAVARPLLARWPGWSEARGGRAADSQWLMGDGLMVAPVLEPGVVEVTDVWVPPGTWYSAWDYSITLSGPSRASLPAPLSGPMPVLLAEATIVPLHMPAMTTHDVVRSPLTLVALLRREPCAASQRRLGEVWRADPVTTHTQSGHKVQQAVPQDGWCAVDWRRVDMGAAPTKTALHRARFPSGAWAGHGHTQDQRRPHPVSPHIHSVVAQNGEVQVAAGTVYADDGGELNPGKPGSSIEAWMTVLVPAGGAATGAAAAAGGAGVSGGAAAGARRCAMCVGRMAYQIMNPAARAVDAEPAAAGEVMVGQQGQFEGGKQTGGQPAEDGVPLRSGDELDDVAALHALSIGTITLLPLDVPMAANGALELQVTLNSAPLPADALAWNATASALTVQLPPGTSAWHDFVLEWGPVEAGVEGA